MKVENIEDFVVQRIFNQIGANSTLEMVSTCRKEITSVALHEIGGEYECFEYKKTNSVVAIISCWGVFKIDACG